VEAQIAYGGWFVVEGPDGIDVLMDIGDVQWRDDFSYIVTLREGYGARLSMPGHLNCTDWTFHKTEKEAIAYCNELLEG